MIATVTITREVEITVEAHYVPGSPATYLQPPDPAEVLIIDAYAEDGKILLTASERDEVIKMVLQDPPNGD
jgi:hypothetical protein